MGHPVRFALLLAASLSVPVLIGSCGSSNSGPTGGPVVAALDSHCTVNGVMMKTMIGMCVTTPGGGDAGSGDAASTTDDAGGDGGGASDSGDDGGGAQPMLDCQGLPSGGGDFGATMCNSEGDDDDCKYHVAWTSSPIRKNANVTFTVTASRLFDNTPATGAAVTIEAYLSPVHPTPSVDISSTEPSPGMYNVGPVVFDQSGMWTVRFHLYETCIDSDDSPHGHAAFYVKVP